jgi:hypothetical protein
MHMADVELDITNEAHEATEIAAQDDFSESYVFQADATTGPATANIDGLRGRGLNLGSRVVGVATFAAVVGEGTLFGGVPLHGRIGDLYVHLGREASVGGGATLYLCVNETPVQWRQVQLGPVIAGRQIAP